MVYFRGNPRDYDGWSAAGAKGWSYAEVLPYFRRSEHNENFGSSVYHGRGGPMNVRTVTRPNPLNFAFFDALAGLGHSYRDDLNGADSEGMGLRQLSIRNGRRGWPATVTKKSRKSGSSRRKPFICEPFIDERFFPGRPGPGSAGDLGSRL